MCKQLSVSRAAYYKWLTREMSENERENRQIAELVERIHTESPDKGYRRMALIMGQEDDALSQSRLTGIKQAMAEEELTVEVVCNESPYALDDAVLDNLLITQNRPEVLLCSNNHLALHCLQHIRRLGLKIPEVLMSGNHQKVNEWRKEKSLEITKKNRPDLLKKAELSEKERKKLE